MRPISGRLRCQKELGSGLTFVAQAYWSGHYTLAQVGEHFGVSYATVSRAVNQSEMRD